MLSSDCFGSPSARCFLDPRNRIRRLAPGVPCPASPGYLLQSRRLLRMTWLSQGRTGQRPPARVRRIARLGDRLQATSGRIPARCGRGRRGPGPRSWRASQPPAWPRLRSTCRAMAGGQPVARDGFRRACRRRRDRDRRARLQRPVLVGHSLGGMIAQTVLRRRPHGYAAAVLCCTSPAFGNPGGDFQRKFVADRLAPLESGKRWPISPPSIIGEIVGPAPDAAGRALAVDCMAAVPGETYRAAVQCLVRIRRARQPCAHPHPRALPCRRARPQRPAADDGTHGQDDSRRP